MHFPEPAIFRCRHDDGIATRRQTVVHFLASYVTFRLVFVSLVGPGVPEFRLHLPKTEHIAFWRNKVVKAASGLPTVIAQLPWSGISG
jgi:hypothetical protein